MNDKISASIELGDLQDDGARLSFHLMIDNQGREYFEVYATPRDSRRKGVFFLFSMDQLSQLEDIVSKAQNARQQLSHSKHQQAQRPNNSEVIDAVLVPDKEAEPRLLFEAARKASQSGNRAATVALLEQIVQIYPDSLYATKAKKSLGR